MNTKTKHSVRNTRRPLSSRSGVGTRLFALFATITLVLINHWTANSVSPPAGSTIGNQASITYDDSSGVSRTATSNVATMIVEQVASFTLTADNTKTVSPGGQVAFPHTIVNTGNG